MEKFWRSLADVATKRVGLVLGAALIISVGLAAYGIPQLEFATGQDSYLNDDERIAVENREYQDLFGGQAMLTLFTAEEGKTVRDLFTPENVAQIQEIEENLRGTDNIDAVVTPLTALEFTANLTEGGTDSPAGQILLRAIERETEAGNTEAAAARTADGQVTLSRTEEIDDRSLENPEFVDFLLTDNEGNIRKALRPFFPFAPGVEPTVENATHAQMVVRLGGNLDIEAEGEASDVIVAEMDGREFENFSIVTTGAPVLLKDINDYLQGGMLTLGGLAVLIMAVILLIAFRVRWRILALIVVLVGVLWAFSLFGVFGLKLSLVTISGLPIMIGMGIDFAIQVHNRLHEELNLNRSERPFQETVLHMAPPLLIATVAAIFAFIALQASRVPMIRDFGVLLALGIGIIWVVGVILPIAILGARERRSPTTPHDPGPSRVERMVVRLGGLPQGSVIPMIVLGVALFGFGILAEDAFEIETDPEKWVDQDTQVVEDLNELRGETGSSSELGLFVQADDIFTDESAAFMTDLAVESLDANPEGLLTASALTTTVAFLMEVPGAPLLAPTGDDLALAYDVAPDDIARSVVSEDQTAANVIFRTGPGSLEARKLIVEDVDARANEIAPEGVAATSSGLAVVGVGLLDNLEANRAELTYIALAAVFVWLLVRFWSLSKALLSLVPVLLAVGVSSLVVAVLGIKLSPLTTVSGPLIIATCTEFSALIITRYIEERHKGLTARESTDVASARTGLAFFTSALTTIGGFAVLIFSALPLLRDFGAIVTLNVFVALLSALVVLPPLLVWADEKGLLKTDNKPEPEPSTSSAA